MLSFLTQIVTMLTAVYANLEVLLGGSKIISDLIGTTDISSVISSLMTAVHF